MNTNFPNLVNSKKKLLLTVVASALAFLLAHNNVANAELIIHDNKATDMATGIATNMPIVKTNKQTVNNANPASLAPTDEEIIKLMQVMRVDQKIEAIVDQRQRMLKGIQGLQNTQKATAVKTDTAPTSNITDEQKQQLGQIGRQIFSVMQSSMGNIGEAIEQSTDKETLTQAYINSAKQHYTAQEVTAMIAFYDTAIGQSILDKQPQVNKTAFESIMSDSMPTTTQMESMQKTTEQVAEILPQIQQVLSGVLAK